jgi:Tol biopolymer transport system component
MKHLSWTIVLAVTLIVVALLGWYSSRVIASGAETVYLPVVGNDCPLIAFRRWSSQIWLVCADGRNERLFLDDGLEPSWAPDGSQLVIQRHDDLYVMNYDEADPQPELRFLAKGHAPAWSPRGDQIAFTYAYPSDSVAQVYVINMDGSGLTRLTQDPTDKRSVSWSRDGALIAFTTGTAGQGHIYTMRSDGSDRRQVTGEAGTYRYPVFSPDGEHLVFTVATDFYQPVLIGGLFLIKLDGTEMTRLTECRPRVTGEEWGCGEHAYPSWSPDGSLLLFGETLYSLPHVFPRWALFVMPSDGGDRRLVLHGSFHGVWVR